MPRHLLALALSLAVLGSAGGADAKKYPVLRWYGQSFFQLETSTGQKIVFDPHAIPQFGRPPVEATVVLVSHEHNDHNQPEVLERAAAARV